VSKTPLIFAVDPELGFLSLLKMRLEEGGYRVHTALTGKEALDFPKEGVDAFILSTELADMSGLELYAELKKRAEFESLPCIFITDKEESEEELRSRHYNYVTKPYDPKGLLSRLERSLRRTSEAVPAAQASPSSALSESDFERISLGQAAIDPAVIEKVPAKYVWHYKFMPVSLSGDVLSVAISDVRRAGLREDLSQYLDLKVKVLLAGEAEIDEAIKKYYGVGSEMVEKIFAGSDIDELRDRADMGELKEGDLEKFAQDTSVISLVNQILIDAQKKNATDIHIEPYFGKLQLRYRVDGVLQDAKVSANIIYFLHPIISRIKIMSGLNIVERRLPQDGRAKIRIKNDTFDLRVSTLPTPYGESMVIRVLPNRRLFGLEELGFAGAELGILDKLIKKPHGVIFVTGPTGSGKSTTLYAFLSKIRKENPGGKIITIEDPIEYEIEGVTQMQVNPEINLTFAKGLRSMLRHDPDVMMVGEVRDYETAEIAIRMALTGHLLFSTLHTNDAASSATRLVDLGLEPFLVASSVEAFIAQRLLRLLCQECKGKGCELCGASGFKGRTVIYEILTTTPEIKDLIHRKATSTDIKKAAVAQGMKTLWETGLEKVAKGLTTEEELLRVTQMLD
jgi:general secretion pathway protein E